MAEPAYAFPRRKDGRSWPAQGEWTYEDYLRLPADGNRYEVIRGVLHVTAAPVYVHQFAVLKLGRFFDEFVSERDLGVVLTAPFDILLPFGIGTPVEPDVMFFRVGNEPRPEDKSFKGVPDLVVEVLSRGTSSRDKKVKRQAYQDAGIPEYWMYYPRLRTLVVLVLEPGKGYRELCRGGAGEEVWSSAIPGFRLLVDVLFPPWRG